MLVGIVVDPNPCFLIVISMVGEDPSFAAAAAAVHTVVLFTIIQTQWGQVKGTT